MSKEIAKITNEDIENVDTLTLMGQEFNMYGTHERPLFLANEIAEMIEYSQDKVGQMLQNVDDDEKLTDTIYRSGQQREMWFLTENGLYELLMQSRKPLAKTFKAEIKKLLHRVRTGQIRTSSTIINSKQLVFEGVDLLFKNFSGKGGQYNKEGTRTFNVVLPDSSKAHILINDGWNVKILRPRDEDEQPRYYLPVEARYDNFPPEAYLINNRKLVALDEESIGTLDYAQLENVDVTLSASRYDVNGKKGIKAYLKTIYATVSSNLLAEKYADYDMDESEDDFPF